MSVLKRTLVNLLGPSFLVKARIAALHEASNNFRFIEIEAEAFKGRRINPGEKVQIDTGGGTLRTYTPHSLDPETGRLGILAYLHGMGPGSAWAQGARVGDACRLAGPRASLRTGLSETPFIFFGDETALSAAAGLHREHQPRTRAKFIFESSVPREMSAVVEDLGLPADIFAVSADGAIPEESLARIVTLARDYPTVILTGKAQSIRQIRARLRAAGHPSSRIIAKPYWSAGRTGLD